MRESRAASRRRARGSILGNFVLGVALHPAADPSDTDVQRLRALGYIEPSSDTLADDGVEATH